MVFKRFKQIAQLGHLPKQDPESAKAWLYGKLFVALPTEKVLAQARALSPWGYDVQAIQTVKPLAGVCLYVSPVAPGGDALAFTPGNARPVATHLWGAASGNSVLSPAGACPRVRG